MPIALALDVPVPPALALFFGWGVNNGLRPLLTPHPNDFWAPQARALMEKKAKRTAIRYTLNGT